MRVLGPIQTETSHSFTDSLLAFSVSYRRAWDGLGNAFRPITQRSVVQIHPPQPSEYAPPRGPACRARGGQYPASPTSPRRRSTSPLRLQKIAESLNARYIPPPRSKSSKMAHQESKLEAFAEAQRCTREGYPASPT